ncbi:MAG: PD-(D/E)XK nuclease family protein [Imperialibacter sp.]|uniref:PDDEXK-like family protein n=1 Tax=Imperialibacter sp. TaxID=2038411 RepID=UPI0032EC2E5E
MTEQLDLNRCKRFFTEYIQLEEQFWQERIEEEINQFKLLQVSYTPLDVELQGLLKKETPFFNVFHILNIGHYETRLHTPFLCHLLNPEESHQQGSLFLDSFMTQILFLPYNYGKMEGFEIYEELSTDYGRIDIFIEFKVDGSYYCVLLENKIYAGDQPQQVDRYFKYITEELEVSEQCFKLLYLTRTGNPPTDGSINSVLAAKLRGTGQLVLKGYHQHIIPWLEGCFPAILSPTVRQTMFQYIKVLEGL